MSYGMLVYQDDVLLTAINLAGYDWLEADKFRKAMGKKIPEEMAKQEIKFKEGVVAHGMTKAKCDELWELIKPFAAYGFNKAHAASYGIVAYQTAYMKANFPAEYMTALMTAESGDLDTVALAVKECESMGIKVLPPDVNSSEAGFTYIDDGNIRFGLNTIKGLGADTVAAIIDERKTGGPFKDLADFAGRIPGKAFNKKSLECLAKSGALDAFEERNRIAENLDVLTTYNKNMLKERDNGQSNLFAFVVPEGTELVPMLGLRSVPPATRKQRLAWEKDLLGLYVSSHPFEEAAKEFGGLFTPLAKALTLPERTPLRVGGTVMSVKQIITKKSGEPMLFATIADQSGSAECLVFPSVFKENGSAWVEGANLAVTGKLSRKDDEPKILADRGWPLTEETIPVYKKHFRGDIVSSAEMLDMHRPKSRATQGEVRVTLPSKLPPAAVASVKAVLAKFPGHALVTLDVRSEGGYQRVETSFLIDPSPDAVAAIEKHVGMGNVRVLHPT
jgi:DNA polymerase-3 subunit alpha